MLLRYEDFDFDFDFELVENFFDFDFDLFDFLKLFPIMSWLITLDSDVLFGLLFCGLGVTDLLNLAGEAGLCFLRSLEFDLLM